jgi:hypothetical protein
MRLARRGFAFAALAALALVSACGDDNNDGGGGDAVDLSGTYTILKYETGAGATYVEVPGTVGTVVLTSTNYTAVISIPGVGPIEDAGTYTANGTATSGSFTQTSTMGRPQATGTFAYDGSTGELVLSTVVSGVNQRITVSPAG